MAPDPSSSQQQQLTATYTSPTVPTSKAFTHSLPSSTTSSTAEKTIYLKILRQSMTQLQDDINVFLTAKMEEDKALAAKTGVVGKIDEKKEEEEYGEEGGDEEG